MPVLGIDEITFGARDLATCRRFFDDWGLQLVAETSDTLNFESLNGCKVIVVASDKVGVPDGPEPDPTLREEVWGVDSGAALETYRRRIESLPSFNQTDLETSHRFGCVDPIGLSIQFQVTQKREIDIECAQTNTWNQRQRINAASPAYDRARPIEVGHVVMFTKSLIETSLFYQQHFDFVLSDQYPGRGHFLRCAAEGGHHDLFLLQLPDARNGLNHVAFAVRDIHEVDGGGLHMSRQGWRTEIGPGRHPISSAIFWYFENPAGALVEYYTDEDELTAAWKPREFQPDPTMFAEWAVKGGIDGFTRRQANSDAPSGKFMTDKKS